ncbi:glucose/galactose MFS transporter [Novosphingobium arvoryzae]|uniref:MFS transporter n=1 Tax=Novosphingobium arvoryzae TaxID=1256514 RepID=A0A918RLC4_9SPHN|nr:glucose/galactose MFS transporter [Novosphingobium arvoryzae]GHA01606.1 MFS transporter [Novosphingobium arvoryzae]
MIERLRALGITGAFLSVTMLFFAWGFICSNNDPLIVALRAAFRLSYTEALLTQLVFFLASGLIALPAAALGNRIGPVRTIIAALATMVAGCLLVRGATGLGLYAPILAALFVLASGITTLQVAANPLAAALGPQRTSHFRLTFAQTFNSLGVVLGVHYGSTLMLGDAAMVSRQGVLADAASRAEALSAVAGAFGIMAALLLVVAVFVWSQRRRIEAAAALIPPAPEASVLAALRSRWALLGAGAIALYVGAEVAIGSIMINFLHQPGVLDLPLEQGGRYLANFYWGGALAGRLIGSVVLTRVAAPRLLVGCAGTAAALCLVVLTGAGPLAGYAALAVGLFNSIMFPTIFTLTLERSDAAPSSTSGLLCLAIVGGAALPLLVGRLADAVSLSAAFVVPAAAYGLIALFALAAGRSGQGRARAEHPA